MKESHIRKFNTVYQSSDCYYGLELRPEFTAWFEDKNLEGMEALDLGCGEGRYSIYLAKKGCRVTAIDRTPAGIQKLQALAMARRLNIEASVKDIADFVFEENQFDVIVAATVLDHLTEDLRRHAIGGMRAALKPGGIIYVNVFTVDDPGYLLKQLPPQRAPKNGTQPSGDGTDASDTAFCMEYYFDKDELSTLFADFDIRYYYEGLEPDLSHGRPHHHGWACLLARKP